MGLTRSTQLVITYLLCGRAPSAVTVFLIIILVSERTTLTENSFITTEGNYDRNHGPIPHIDASIHRVHVDGLVRQPIELSASQLKFQFPQHEVICALQCAGNRRHTMRTFIKEVSGLDWGDGAVMNCRWRGPRLSDVLTKAGLQIPREDGNHHVAFACYKTEVQDDTWYGGSIALSRAIDPSAEVILALEMNGRVLPTNHGFPVRVIAPGIAGARCVKWLDRITVQAEESPCFYQQRDYKALPPEATDKESAEKYWSVTPAMQAMPINSVIIEPANEATIDLPADGIVTVRGYALPSGDHGPVAKVEVSVDEGKTWTQAEMIPDQQIGTWTWALWTTKVHLDKGTDRRILSRAYDSVGNTQPGEPVWNFRGVGYNGYGESRKLIVR